jgi:SAM-dependent methyltransferase
MTDEKPHSADWMGEDRELWWNPDYLALVAERLGLREAKRALDVGSGQGHWSQTILPLLHPEARLTGIDPEPEWNLRASQRAAERGVGSRCEYLAGTAYELPFGDSEFDLVTSQTLLIHLAEPERAVSEMARVLEPGGLLLSAEPNNRANGLIENSVIAQHSIEDRLLRFGFYLTCEAGKARLGLGDNSLGDRVPFIFRRCGLRDVRAYLNDRALLVDAPYDGTGAVWVNEERKRIDAEMGPWPRDETFRYFLAGGGNESEFERLWEKEMQLNGEIRAALDRKSFSWSGASMMYLVAGWK